MSWYNKVSDTGPGETSEVSPEMCGDPGLLPAASSLGKFSLKEDVGEELKSRTELGGCYLRRMGSIEAG